VSLTVTAVSISNLGRHVRFEVPTAVTMKDTNVCNVTPCSLVKIKFLPAVLLWNNVTICFLFGSLRFVTVEIKAFILPYAKPRFEGFM
jgi:hypothetical protein